MVHQKISDLLKKARQLPSKAGCYLMINREGKILYVGKAKNLRNRVSSYFGRSHKSPKTEILLASVFDIEFIITGNEAEALILENNLIKKHSPRYNILMRDDKSYPYIQVDFREKYPQIEYTRRPSRGDKREVFGPFVHGTHIGKVLRVIIKSFKLRDCSLHEFKGRKEPCLLYQMNQCSAPCVKFISPEKYHRDIQLALDFFRGKEEYSLLKIQEEMDKLSSQEEFEQAAIVRDHIETLKEFVETSKQKNVEFSSGIGDFDVTSFHEGSREVDIALYLVRNNLLLGHKVFHFPLMEYEEDAETLVVKFLLQYYTHSHDSLPKRIYSSLSSPTFKLFKEAINIQSKLVMVVSRPTREIRSLMDLTTEYACEHQRFRMSNREHLISGAAKIKELLNLKKSPTLIECFDVAVFQGTSPTASQVVFKNGEPEKKAYRHYHLSTREEGNNDFAMMEELLTKRLAHGDFPDLFVVDGGKGQVNVVQRVLKEKNISVPVVGIAKSKRVSGSDHGTKTQERLIIPGRSNPYPLHRHKGLFKIMVHLRNEAHRFSRRLHHKEESKRHFSSWIDEVEGIGLKTKKKILKNLDVPFSEVANMPHQFLSRKIHIRESLAKRIIEAAIRKTEQ